MEYWRENCTNEYYLTIWINTKKVSRTDGGQ
jgi:hypothetical protein